MRSRESRMDIYVEQKSSRLVRIFWYWRGGQLYILPLYFPNSFILMLFVTKKWFTLAELMIVIGIIGILAASLYPSLSSYLARWRDVTKISRAKELRNSLVTYNTSMGRYDIPWTWSNGTGAGIMNYVWDTSAITGPAWMIIGIYTKSIISGLKELGYLQGVNITIETDWHNNPILNDLTRQYCPAINTSWLSADIFIYNYNSNAVVGYLETIDRWNNQNYWPLCLQYGYNYAIQL